MSRSLYYSHNNKFSTPFKHNLDSSLLTILWLDSYKLFPQIQIRNNEQKQVEGGRLRRRKTLS